MYKSNILIKSGQKSVDSINNENLPIKLMDEITRNKIKNSFIDDANFNKSTNLYQIYPKEMEERIRKEYYMYQVKQF